MNKGNQRYSDERRRQRRQRQLFGFDCDLTEWIHTGYAATDKICALCAKQVERVRLSTPRPELFNSQQLIPNLLMELMAAFIKRSIVYFIYTIEAYMYNIYYFFTVCIYIYTYTVQALCIRHIYICVFFL